VEEVFRQIAEDFGFELVELEVAKQNTKGVGSLSWLNFIKIAFLSPCLGPDSQNIS